MMPCFPSRQPEAASLSSNTHGSALQSCPAILSGNHSCQGEGVPRVQSIQEQAQGKDKKEVSLCTFICLYCYHMFCSEHCPLFVKFLEAKNSSQHCKQPLAVNESAERQEPKEFPSLPGAQRRFFNLPSMPLCILPYSPPPSCSQGTRDKEGIGQASLTTGV